MKFKVYKHQIETLTDLFKHKSDIHSIIELEPIMDSCADMQLKASIEEAAFKYGRDLGYKEGWFDARRGERNEYRYKTTSP